MTGLFGSPKSIWDCKNGGDVAQFNHERGLAKARAEFFKPSGSVKPSATYSAGPIKPNSKPKSRGLFGFLFD